MYEARQMFMECDHWGLWDSEGNVLIDGKEIDIKRLCDVLNHKDEIIAELKRLRLKHYD